MTNGHSYLLHMRSNQIRITDYTMPRKSCPVALCVEHSTTVCKGPGSLPGCDM